MHVWQSLISEAFADRRWVIAEVHTHCRWCGGLLSLCLRLWLDTHPAGENLLTRCMHRLQCVHGALPADNDQSQTRSWARYKCNMWVPGAEHGDPPLH